MLDLGDIQEGIHMQSWHQQRDSRPYHVWVDLMSEARDVHHIWPIIRLHQHPSSMSTRDGKEAGQRPQEHAGCRLQRPFLTGVSAEHALLWRIKTKKHCQFKLC